MFNLYQNMNKRGEQEGGGEQAIGSAGRRRESDVTGHDRFYQERPRSRRKRRNFSRRTQSAIEFDTEAMTTARAILRRGRSASIEEEESEDDRAFQFTNKIDSLAKILFNRVSVSAKACRDNESRNRGHQYRTLGNGSTGGNESSDVGESIEMERRTRDRALSICKSYIRLKSSRYSLIEQLNNVGSRVDKHWFAVNDTMLKTDRLLTLVPLNRNCSLSVSSATRDTLNELFLALQHPYICPVLDLEFIENKAHQQYVILVQPMNQGSLKDLIYGIEKNRWNEDWGKKYAARGRGLPLVQIQRMGRQILEALVFLKERAFPTVRHLHSGNVIVQNGVARLAGLENSLLGFTSRIQPVVTSRSSSGSIDSICFGHMLFEMCAGYELCSFKPSSMHLNDLRMYPQVGNLMNVIFNKTNGLYPSVEELLLHDIFRNIDLREMRSAPVTIFRPTLTPPMMNLLDSIKRHSAGKRLSNIETDDMISFQSSDIEPAKEDTLLEEIYNELSHTTV